MRQTRKFVAYSEAENAWREIEFAGNITIAGTLDLGSTHEEDRQNARHRGAAHLVCNTH